MTDWVLDEVELIRRCREGSDAAYAVLVREHRPRLYTLAHRLTGDRATAEDVVQEAFLAAFKAIDRFEPKPSLSAWLNTITVRIAKRAASRARARTNTSLDQATEAGDPATFAGARPGPLVDGDPVAAAESAELRAQVAAAIERLPFNYRAAVVLRFVTGLDYAAAAESMDVPLNTFKSHLLRGTKLLRADLAHHLETAPGDDLPGRGPVMPPTSTPEPQLDRTAPVVTGIGVSASTPPRRS
ncbi:MAG TPA: RNA polymerase sigma factor [Candidatus Sulfomarinibacteraceae bacterium]|nr:RNA polymerase sigma factor [Candidatus Sulfomarinibacteraceae bacterium]